MDGWICGADNTLLKTENGGDSWNLLSSGTESTNINIAIKFVDEKNGWISNFGKKRMKLYISKYYQLYVDA